MTAQIYPDIPRIYTAIAEWAASLRQEPREKNGRNMQPDADTPMRFSHSHGRFADGSVASVYVRSRPYHAVFH